MPGLFSFHPSGFPAWKATARTYPAATPVSAIASASPGRPFTTSGGDFQNIGDASQDIGRRFQDIGAGVLARRSRAEKRRGRVRRHRRRCLALARRCSAMRFAIQRPPNLRSRTPGRISRAPRPMFRDRRSMFRNRRPTFRERGPMFRKARPAPRDSACGASCAVRALGRRGTDWATRPSGAGAATAVSGLTASSAPHPPPTARRGTRSSSARAIRGRRCGRWCRPRDRAAAARRACWT